MSSTTPVPDPTATVIPSAPIPSAEPAAAPAPAVVPDSAPVAPTEASAPAAKAVPAPIAVAPTPSSSQAPATSASAKPSTPKSKKKKAAVTVTMATAATAQSGSIGAQGENTGRWTAEEHHLFLQGLEQHGKGWKKIASLIKSRTVVQIRTHAQKYFQKLAKARQNGEEGEISMEGRGGTAAVPSVSTAAAQSNKRRRQTSGTKRKAIQSVVSSAQRQGKKLAAAEASSGVPNPVAPLPSVAPALAPYVLPDTQPPHAEAIESQPCVPSISTSQGTITGPALEDSLFRFLTPAPVAASEPAVNEVARQAGANPIQVPAEQPGATLTGGEVSPTGVADFALYPSWTDAKDTPSWYAKGSDVDALLDVADTLDWLTDTGDISEDYHPGDHCTEIPPSIPDPTCDKPVHSLSHHPSVSNMSMNTLPRVDSAVEVVVPPLPSLFDGAADTEEEPTKTLSEPQLAPSASTNTIDDHLQVFDTPLEEHDFVSSMLENTGESSASLPVLQ